MFRIAICALAVIILGGCQTPIVDEVGPLSVTEVRVSVAGTAGNVSDVRTPLRRAATREIVGLDPSGRPAIVEVNVTNVMYKNPLAAALVGSANRMISEVSIKGVDGTSITDFDHITTLDSFPQGILGAIDAANQDKVEVDAELARTHARDLRQRMYGNKERPAEVAPPPAPATAPSTTEPGVPVS